MNTYFEIRNDWDEKSLSQTNEWRNDGENCQFETLEQAQGTVAINEDCERLHIVKCTPALDEDGNIEEVSIEAV